MVELGERNHVDVGVELVWTPQRCENCHIFGHLGGERCSKNEGCLTIGNGISNGQDNDPQLADIRPNIQGNVVDVTDFVAQNVAMTTINNDEKNIDNVSLGHEDVGDVVDCAEHNTAMKIVSIVEKNIAGVSLSQGLFEDAIDCAWQNIVMSTVSSVVVSILCFGTDRAVQSLGVYLSYNQFDVLNES
ncbi:hypothetical protein V6N13_071227 [Hibiscus sabdariffa]|uniref:Uncharacterized protein n=1 Tax=Hibiscus sabdariffa TaxID=183260 RepID=A0ABR2TE14_9ROSI